MRRMIGTKPLLGLGLGRRFGLAGQISPASVQAAITQAVRDKTPLIFDRDFELTGDVLIDRPVHLKLPLGVTVSMADAPVWQHGAGTVGDVKYFGGLFTFRPGSEGTIFEAHGALDVNQAGAGSVGPAPVQAHAVAMIGVEHTGNIRLTGRPKVLNAHSAGITIRAAYWADRHWPGSVFSGSDLNISDPQTDPPA